MVVEPRQREGAGLREPHGATRAALEALADASRALAEGESLTGALATIAAAAARATGAQLVLVRVLDPGDGQVFARAVWASSPALAAELEGSRYPAAELPDGEADNDDDTLSPGVRRAAERIGAGAVLQIPVVVAGSALGSLELLRTDERFSRVERTLARVLADQVGLALRAAGEEGQIRELSSSADDGLERAGDALAAGTDEARTAEAATRLGAQETGAAAAILWRRDDDELALVASFGLEPDAALGGAVRAVAAALAEPGPVTTDDGADQLPADADVSVTLPLGEPPMGALQLLFPRDTAPSPKTLRRLATFGVRAAHALRSTERARTVELELDRTRALLEVVGQAIAHLSLAHTLETAVERLAELLGADRLAVYLREEGRLLAAAGLGLAGPHVRVAERLLELALGPFRGRGVLVLDDTVRDPRLAGVRDALSESGIEAAIAVPLLVHEELIGLLGVYVPRGRTLTENESALLTALAAQLAVAVENARLHERAVRAERGAKEALQSEQQAAGRLRALYEISSSFAESLSLERTLDAVARTVVELLPVDAAVIRMPDERREQLVQRATHVAAPQLEEPVRTIFSRPQPLARLPGRRLFRAGKPLVLDAPTAAALGASYELLVPFLEKGSTVAVVPVKTPAEVLATLTVVSLDPGRPLTDETVDAALAIAGQAALAIDNARLYKQQKEFADTMQRSLLPASPPTAAGLDLGAVYASSARVEVGGDVYDFLALADGRLAVVLGDVTGHGIDATADMAMAKFVFRSLAREHPEPADFLAFANEVVVGEIAPAKFITMVYLVADPERNEIACAGAGHPPPRVVEPDGTVDGLEISGLALGIEAGQRYEEVRRALAPGAAVVLYTDGVIEARRGAALFGLERLDELLVRKRALPAEELAQAVLAECRAFAGGELRDDCAVVVIRRTA
jgi:serine phosphatase RsbU (regulator of sigma subunit)